MKVDNGAQGTKMVNVNYPANSKSKNVTEEKKVEKVIKGSVVKRKKSASKKVFESFVGEDVDTVMSYIVHDVLIPAAKNTITDMVQGGIEMLLFGERQGSRTRRDGNKSYVNYGSYSGSKRDSGRNDRRDVSRQNRARHNFDEICLDSRSEAEEVLSHLVDLVIDYGEATVADLYDLVGITGNFTDNKYGWKDLSSASVSVSRVRDGYIINLPRVKPLD